MELFKRVKGCIDEWDPIGLLAMGAPENEYNFEIKAIVAVAQKINNANELAEHVFRIFTDAFGSDTFICSKKDVLKIAEAVIIEKKKSE